MRGREEGCVILSFQAPLRLHTRTPTGERLRGSDKSQSHWLSDTQTVRHNKKSGPLGDLCLYLFNVGLLCVLTSCIIKLPGRGSKELLPSDSSVYFTSQDALKQ